MSTADLAADLLTTVEAARIFSTPRYDGEEWPPVTNSQIRTMIRRGHIPAQRKGRDWLIARHDVIRIWATWRRLKLVDRHRV